jgi:hypothetical protein
MGRSYNSSLFYLLSNSKKVMNEFNTPIENNYQLANQKIPKTIFYEHDTDNGFQIEVKALKGIIELTNLDANIGPAPAPGCASSVALAIFNPRLVYANPDRVYIQTTVYYSPGANDLFVPYLVPTGASFQGVGFSLFNVSNETAGAGQFTGKLYINYEIYSF